MPEVNRQVAKTPRRKTGTSCRGEASWDCLGSGPTKRLPMTRRWQCGGGRVIQGAPGCRACGGLRSGRGLRRDQLERRQEVGLVLSCDELVRGVHLLVTV